MVVFLPDAFYYGIKRVTKLQLTALTKNKKGKYYVKKNKFYNNE